MRSVAGTVDIAEDDPDLLLADGYLNATFTASLDRPFLAREQTPESASGKGKRRG